MRIDPPDDSHPEPTATADHLTKAVMGPEIGAAVMKRDIRRIKRNGPASAQTGALGANLLEVAQPEFRIVVARIIFSECNLDPAMGTDGPAAVRRTWHSGLRGCEDTHGSFCRVHRAEPHYVAPSNLSHVSPFQRPRADDTSMTPRVLSGAEAQHTRGIDVSQGCGEISKACDATDGTRVVLGASSQIELAGAGPGPEGAPQNELLTTTVFDSDRLLKPQPAEVMPLP